MKKETVRGDTGLGHQLFHDRKCVDACRSSLEQAYNDISRVDENRTKIFLMMDKIDALITECSEISHSMDEALNINT